jgi:hypothetical protein
MSADNPHPEDFCQVCERPNVVWWVDSDRFNLAMGGLGLTRSAIVCPSCFVKGHEQATGLSAAWEIKPSTVFRPIDHQESQ